MFLGGEKQTQLRESGVAMPLQLMFKASLRTKQMHVKGEREEEGIVST